MEEALHDMPMFREFAKLDSVLNRLPDASTILRFRHLLSAPSPTKNGNLWMVQGKLMAAGACLRPKPWAQRLLQGRRTV